MKFRLIILGALALGIAACGPLKKDPAELKNAFEGAETVLVTSAEGGIIELDNGAKLDIPAGAVDGDVEITVSTDGNTEPPDDVVSYSQVYTFEPAGLVFNLPVEITLPVESGASNPTVYWSRYQADGYDDAGGSRDADTISTHINHFSTGFVGAEVDIAGYCGAADSNDAPEGDGSDGSGEDVVPGDNSDGDGEGEGEPAEGEGETDTGGEEGGSDTGGDSVDPSDGSDGESGGDTGGEETSEPIAFEGDAGVEDEPSEGEGEGETRSGDGEPSGEEEEPTDTNDDGQSDDELTAGEGEDEGQGDDEACDFTCANGQACFDGYCTCASDDDCNAEQECVTVAGLEDDVRDEDEESDADVSAPPGSAGGGSEGGSDTGGEEGGSDTGGEEGGSDTGGEEGGSDTGDEEGGTSGGDSVDPSGGDEPTN